MPPVSKFYGLGIAPNILELLNKHGFTTPTPIQEKSIPVAIEGKDIIGIAQTGTGKTLAFGIPMLQAALAGKHGLVVLPTRELALQVHDSLNRIGGPLGVKMAVMIGGEAMFRQLQALRRKPTIFIGTPGRIIDHLEHKTLSLKNVSMLVLDEADRMLDMGFAPQLRRILEVTPKERQTLLFSATMPTEIFNIAHKEMKLPTHLEIAPQGTLPSEISQEMFFLNRNDKLRLLGQMLSEYRGSVLVFVRMKHEAKRIATQVRAMGHKAVEIHSNRTLGQRREAMSGFRNGTYRVLIATDIAARGIDVKGIELVVNYDLPGEAGDYVHRIGRTGRTGNVGHAVSFATPDQGDDVRSIEKLIRKEIPRATRPGVETAKEAPPVRAIQGRRTFRGHGGRFRGVRRGR